MELKFKYFEGKALCVFMVKPTPYIKIQKIF